MLIFLATVFFMLAEFVAWYNESEISGLRIFSVVFCGVGIFSITISTTIPGTGLPMVIISSKLAVERISKYN